MDPIIKDGNDASQAVLEALPFISRRLKRQWWLRLGTKACLLWMAFAIALPSPRLLACACSEVVVGSGMVTSSMSVSDESGTLELVQSDIELPGLIPVELTRTYQSSTSRFGMFGPGWSVNFVSHLETTTGAIKVHFPGSLVTFIPAEGYTSEKKDLKLSFTDPDEVTVEDRRGGRWIFSTADRQLKKYVDRNGNEVVYTWKVVSKLMKPSVPLSTGGGVWYTDPIYEDVFCPLTVTYPDSRQLTFSYDTTGDYQYLCREATSPSGFTVSYDYTDGLLTGISKSNGQILSYEYYKFVNYAATTGRLTKITYANAAEVEITYGEGGKVVNVTGPEGHNHSYDYGYGSISTDIITLPADVTTLTDSNNKTTSYAHTEGGYNKQVEDALGYSAFFYKNSRHLATIMTDRRGKTSLFAYDKDNTDPLLQGNLLSRTNPLGKTWRYTWDSGRNLTQIKDPLDHEFNRTYDTKGNPLTVENGLGRTVLTNTYTARGELATTKDGLNNTSSFQYSTNGLLTKATDAIGKDWLFGYDDAGNLLTFENPNGKIWTTTFNDFYKPATSEDPLGNRTVYTYDEMANLTKVEDANNNEVEISYDLLQRITSIKDALGKSIRLTYDAETNLTKLTDPLSREYTYTFDAVNQTKTFKFPDDSEESYDYDPGGNLTKWTNRAGEETTLSYDDASRLMQKRYEVTSGYPTVFSYTYDDANRLTGATRTVGMTVDSTIEYTYDAADRVTFTTAEGHTVGYTYNAAQLINQITYPSSEVVKYEYDSRRSLSAIKDGGNAAVATYTKDDTGRVIRRELPNGLETIYTWNDSNWLVQLELRETANPSNVLQSVEYGYDNVGNRLWIKAKDGRGDVYQYDATYQVTGVKYDVDDPTVGYSAAVNPSHTVTYKYDAVGNRISLTENGASTAYTANSLNQYTHVGGVSYTYSGRGDLIGDNGTWTYSYDYQGRLINASTIGTAAAYKYDSVGRRIEKNVNNAITRYIYNGYNLIEERDGNDNVLAKYIYESGIDRPIKVLNGESELYFIQDDLGSVIALVDNSGGVVERYEYDVFGRPTIKDGNGMVKASAMTPFLFTGREFDGETKLYHFRTRAYSPVLGRFLQSDPIDFFARDVNLYRYVSNNPINYLDPFGLARRQSRSLDGFGGVKVGKLRHDRFKYDDGTDSGYYDDGKIRPDKPENDDRYEDDVTDLDDDCLRQAEENVRDEWLKKDYHKFKHNCQHYCDAVMEEYNNLMGQRK